MDRGFYTSISAMMCGNKLLDDVGNNIANISTTGYKKDISTMSQFSNLPINKTDEDVYVGNLVSQVHMDETFTIYSDGAISITNNPNDYAIIGDGFFKVDVNGEDAYTRDGSFKVDSKGYLVTNEGYFVLDKNNNRIIVEEGKDFSDRLMIVDFEDKQTLARTDENLFINKFGLSEESPVNAPRLKAGCLESSNVDAATELTDMIKTQRYYQLNQRSLSVRDELLQKISEF